MALPVQFLQELKLRNDIYDIASRYVSLKRTGRSYVGLCPFHNEKTPSFHVYPDSSSYYCFGCHAGGDLISFVKSAENLDYIEAVKFLADRAGLHMPDDSFESRPKHKERTLEINREAARFYHTCLLAEEGREGLDYLRGRGLTAKTIRHFGLGFAPASRYALCNHLTKLGYSKDELIIANVAFTSRSGNLVDRFINRVIFPIIDLRGNVLGFGGRIMTDQKPKYLNTSDTPVFKKSGNLFAMNFAKNSGEDCLILCEGYMDVIALHQAGITNVIATLGTALTESQAVLISRYTKDVAVCYDADSAGQNAAKRAIGILRNAGLKVRVVSIPDGKDPDEFIKNHGKDGEARFRQLVAKSSNDVLYRWSRLEDNFDITTPDGKTAFINEALAVVCSLYDPIERDVYYSRLAEKTGVDKNAIKISADRILSRKRREGDRRQFREHQLEVTGARDRVNPEKIGNLKAAAAEEYIIAYLLQQPEEAVIQRLKKELTKDGFCTAFNAHVYELIIDLADKNGSCSLTELSEMLSADEMSAVARITAKASELTLGKDDVERYMNVIAQEKLRKQVSDTASSSPEAILRYIQSVKDQKK